MGKIGRIACIATPGVLTVISLILLILVFVAGMNTSNTSLTSLYYIQVNTTDFRNQVFLGINVLDSSLVDNNFLNALNTAFSQGKIADIYNIYLSNYCSSTSTDGTLTFCSDASPHFYFNIIDVLGLNGTDSASYIPSTLTDGLAIYAKVAVWMYIAYMVALWATVASLVMGLLAICTRWGSFLTSIVISISTLFTILAATTSTVLFSTLTASAIPALKPYGIAVELGTKMLALEWATVAISILAWIFWVASICCCSGKSSSPRRQRGSQNKGHYDDHFQPLALNHGIAPGFHGIPFVGNQGRGYQPLEGQGGTAGAMEMGHMNSGVNVHSGYGNGGMGGVGGASAFKGRETAYEPFRT